MADDPATNLNPEYSQQGFAAVNNTTQVPTTANGKEGILDQTLAEVLETNPQAQNLIMQSMHLTPEKFQEMLASAQSNNMMHTKIRDLFTSGVVQQAVGQQGAAEVVQQPQKVSFFQQLKKLFR